VRAGFWFGVPILGMSAARIKDRTGRDRLDGDIVNCLVFPLLRPALLNSRGYLDLSKTSVLMMDDNRNTLTLIGEVLRGLGVRTVIKAQTNAEALRHLQTRAIDLVLVDIALSADSGLWLVRQIRQGTHRVADIPVLVVSSYATELRVMEAGVAGATQFLSKPITVGSLAAKVAAALLAPMPNLGWQPELRTLSN